MSYSVLYIFVTVISRQQYFAHISVSIQSSILEGCTSILRVKGRSLLPKGDHYYQRESEQRGRGRGRYSGTHESEGPDWTQGGGREGDKWYRVIREPELICFGIFKGDKQAERCEGDVAPTRIFRGGKLGTGGREECGLAIQQLNRV